jgi:hypothetical protein
MELWSCRTVYDSDFHSKLEKWAQNQEGHSVTTTPEAWVEAANEMVPVDIGLRERHNKKVEDGPKSVRVNQHDLDARPCMEEFTRTLRDAAAVHIDKETLFKASGKQSPFSNKPYINTVQSCEPSCPPPHV